MSCALFKNFQRKMKSIKILKFSLDMKSNKDLIQSEISFNPLEKEITSE